MSQYYFPIELFSVNILGTFENIQAFCKQKFNQSIQFGQFGYKQFTCEFVYENKYTGVTVVPCHPMNTGLLPHSHMGRLIHVERLPTHFNIFVRQSKTDRLQFDDVDFATYCKNPAFPNQAHFIWTLEDNSYITIMNMHPHKDIGTYFLNRQIGLFFLSLLK